MRRDCSRQDRGALPRRGFTVEKAWTCRHGLGLPGGGRWFVFVAPGFFRGPLAITLVRPSGFQPGWALPVSPGSTFGSQGAPVGCAGCGVPFVLRRTPRNPREWCLVGYSRGMLVVGHVKQVFG